MRNQQSVHMARMWCGARDSAVLEWLVRGELWQSECFEVLGIEVLSNSIPTVLTAERLGNYKSRIYHIKTLYNLGLCLAVKPPPFDKGGKSDGDFRGIVRFWKGWCGARDSGVAIPPVVARIFSGDSTSPLTREASVIVQSKG